MTAQEGSIPVDRGRRRRPPIALAPASAAGGFASALVQGRSRHGADLSPERRHCVSPHPLASTVKITFTSSTVRQQRRLDRTEHSYRPVLMNFAVVGEHQPRVADAGLPRTRVAGPTDDCPNQSSHTPTTLNCCAGTRRHVFSDNNVAERPFPADQRDGADPLIILISDSLGPPPHRRANPRQKFPEYPCAIAQAPGAGRGADPPDEG
jgi:hypothetical protein